MFGGIGWPEFFILLVAALVILGPERLPGAMQWTMGAVRQARDYLNGTADRLRSEIGPELDPLREPLAQLNELRGMSPRAMTTKYLLDGDDSIFTGEFHPAAGTSEPAVETSEPIVRTSQPAAGTSEPVVRASEPAAGAFEPAARSYAGETVDPANCGIVRPDEWAGAAEAPPADVPPIDTEAT